jgi:hypothetical protein
MSHAAPAFRIDKYIKLPPIKRGPLKPRSEKYPWSHMKPGDSFFVPGARVATGDKRPNVHTMLTLDNVRKRYPGTKWTIRAVTENGVNGCRVWRVS